MPQGCPVRIAGGKGSDAMRDTKSGRDDDELIFVLRVARFQRAIMSNR